MNPINDAFEDFSHSLRVLLEADFRANTQGLIQVDRAEAVGNIEAAMGGVLNSFHSLHDAMQKSGNHKDFNWYDIPELATILVLRNARHHNHARKIRTMYSYYAQEAVKIGSMEMYVLVDYPAGDEGANTFDVYLSWSDLKYLLSLPQKETRIKPALAASINSYLRTHKHKEYAEYFDLEEQRVFFNVIPLFVNAAVKLISGIKTQINPRSTESETYLSLFQHILPADTMNHEVNCGPVAYMP